MPDRMRRVNDALKEVLGAAIGELKDPRIGFVTVTGVDTLRDLSHARVYVSVLGTVKEREESLAGLAAAHGVLQTRVANAIRMKRTPTLEFEYDPTVEGGMRMTQLIDELDPHDD